jgi:hypothetical protein
MQDAETVLKVIRQRGQRGLPLERLYRQLSNPDLYRRAYARLYRNEGALTPGATPETVDGMSLAKIEALIAAVRQERYRWTPVRRTYIAKRHSTKKRPLGLPILSSHCLSIQAVFRFGNGGESARPLIIAHHQWTGEWRVQRRRSGRRKSAIASGVRRIHQGPWGTVWMPSRRPAAHHVAMVETVTLRSPAAPRAE